MCKSFKIKQITILRKIKWKRRSHNTAFWKTVKPLFSDKLKTSEKIIEEDGKSFTQDIKVAEERNSFFSNVTKTLQIPEYGRKKPLAEEIANAILKSVLKYDKHPREQPIRNPSIGSYFEISFVSVAEVLKEIKKFYPRKAA